MKSCIFIAHSSNLVKFTSLIYMKLIKSWCCGIVGETYRGVDDNGCSTQLNIGRGAALKKLERGLCCRNIIWATLLNISIFAFVIIIFLSLLCK